MKSLQLVRDLITPLGAIDTLINLGSHGSSYSNQEIAKIIRGVNYNKAKERLDKLKAKCQEKLSEEQHRVDSTQAEYNALVSQANSNRPGSAPSSFLVDKKDPDSVNRHNQRVREYIAFLGLMRYSSNNG